MSASGCNITVHRNICVAVVVQICAYAQVVRNDVSGFQCYIAVIMVGDGNALPACDITVYFHFDVAVVVTADADCTAGSVDAVHRDFGVAVIAAVDTDAVIFTNDVFRCDLDAAVVRTVNGNSVFRCGNIAVHRHFQPGGFIRVDCKAVSRGTDVAGIHCQR